MKKPYYLLFVLLPFAWQGCSRGRSELARQLDQQIAPLPEGSPRQYKDRYLENLLPWEDYTLIGLGEATHGTLDFVQLRQRLFRFLVENHGCRVLAYEYSFRKSLLVNDYIHHRHNQLDSLFRGDLWIQDNDTLRQFVSWMREYNEGRAEQEQISFVGIDNQVDALTIDEVIQQIGFYLPELDLEWDLPFNVKGTRKVDYHRMSEMEYTKLKHAIHRLELKVEHHGLTCTLPLDRDHAGVALLLLRSLQASHEFLYRLSKGSNIRDRQLAENLMRIVHDGNRERPVVVWAHNAHVACNPHYTPEGSPSMGWYLRDSLNSSYLSVATSFSVGQFTAVMLDSAGNDTAPLTCSIATDPPGESVNALFLKARYPDFSLDIRNLHPDGLLYRYFDRARPMIGVGDLYLGSPELHFTEDRILNLLQAHDFLFYFSHTRPLLQHSP